VFQKLSSLAVVMKLTAMIALYLALAEFARPLFQLDAMAPFFAFLVVGLTVVLVHSFVLSQPLGAFHAAFLAVGLLSSLTAAVIVKTEMPELIAQACLSTLRRSLGKRSWFPLVSRASFIRSLITSVAVLLSPVLATEAGRQAARWRRRQSPSVDVRVEKGRMLLEGFVIGLGSYFIGIIILFGLFMSTRFLTPTWRIVVGAGFGVSSMLGGLWGMWRIRRHEAGSQGRLREH
jgi:hypothetical protein